jgi:hypothetical protein
MPATNGLPENGGAVAIAAESGQRSSTGLFGKRRPPQQESEDAMQANEGRIAPIAALIAMLLVSVMIVALAYWSGDLFGPSTSAPPTVVEQRGVEAVPSMTRSGGGTDAAGALQGSPGATRMERGMHAAGVTSDGAELPRR